MQCALTTSSALFPRDFLIRFSRVISKGVSALYEDSLLAEEGVEDLWRDLFMRAPFVRSERAQAYLAKGRGPGL